eukprot:CAMPEP_0206028486 /NCGR_PEP_ID=MMETSP1464-20131121/45023_1 /ASSEMBLY_ACC=CAM_ASM_001124 /TAXON_ID=119497 /ORGANISM="Exanthemachrysis gayraliae, Strain RCC1523" /LENGTH=61 /DNA_ID=CAMNT_0053402547 /DNA_START=89 /DNA_END=270 /DNA_ORIENTATION=+
MTGGPEAEGGHGVTVGVSVSPESETESAALCSTCDTSSAHSTCTPGEHVVDGQRQSRGAGA